MQLPGSFLKKDKVVNLGPRFGYWGLGLRVPVVLYGAWGHEKVDPRSFKLVYTSSGGSKVGKTCFY
jgi:hypothetical protein